MAIVVSELADSRNSTTIAGRNTSVRTFKVYDLATPITTDIAVRLILGTNGLPYYGDQYPDAVTPFVASSVSAMRRSWAMQMPRTVPVVAAAVTYSAAVEVSV